MFNDNNTIAFCVFCGVVTLVLCMLLACNTMNVCNNECIILSFNEMEDIGGGDCSCWWSDSEYYKYCQGYYYDCRGINYFEQCTSTSGLVACKQTYCNPECTLEEMVATGLAYFMCEGTVVAPLCQSFDVC